MAFIGLLRLTGNIYTTGIAPIASRSQLSRFCDMPRTMTHVAQT
jgi:hypothetical protein